MPLTEAAEHGHSEVVKLLLSLEGVDVNDAPNDFGYTALHCACSEGRILVVGVFPAAPPGVIFGYHSPQGK